MIVTQPKLSRRGKVLEKLMHVAVVSCRQNNNDKGKDDFFYNLYFSSVAGIAKSQQLQYVDGCAGGH
jgi:hypothetical protein